MGHDEMASRLEALSMALPFLRRTGVRASHHTPHSCIWSIGEINYLRILTPTSGDVKLAGRL